MLSCTLTAKERHLLTCIIREVRAGRLPYEFLLSSWRGGFILVPYEGTRDELPLVTSAFLHALPAEDLLLVHRVGPSNPSGYTYEAPPVF